jgi:quercetin dioxygenase-like cupin family protein
MTVQGEHTMTAIQHTPRVVTNKVIKDRVTFVQRTDGNGSPTVLEIELAPDGGNPLHIHTTYDETFTCLRGTLGLQVGAQELLLKPGETATAHEGTVHRFFNPSQESVTFRVELTPGHRGFEQSVIVAYGLANDGLTDANAMPKNPLHIAVLLELGGMTFPGVLGGWMVRALRPLAAYARASGVEQALLRKYDA